MQTDGHKDRRKTIHASPIIAGAGNTWIKARGHPPSRQSFWALNYDAHSAPADSHFVTSTDRNRCTYQILVQSNLAVELIRFNHLKLRCRSPSWIWPEVDFFLQFHDLPDLDVSAYQVSTQMNNPWLSYFRRPQWVSSQELSRNTTRCRPISLTMTAYDDDDKKNSANYLKCFHCHASTWTTERRITAVCSLYVGLAAFGPQVKKCYV